MSDSIVVSRRGPALLLRLNRPDDANRIDGRMIAQLHRAFDEADTDESVRVAIIAGSSEVFCVGGRVDGHPNGTTSQQLAYSQAFCDLRARMFRAQVPTMAVVEGRCTAGGVALMASCDLALAGDDAVFGFPEVNFGLFPLLAMGVMHPLLSPKVAFDFFYTGREFGAEEARSMHLVNRTAPKAELWHVTDRIVDELAGKNRTTVALGRKAYYAMVGMGPAARLDYAQTMLATMLAAGTGAVPH